MNFDWSLLANPSWIWSTLGAVLAIVVIDLALSGDNAAVIGLAIKDLPKEQRKSAAALGAGGAIVLRVIFTALATLLMKVKFINAIGGVLLLWITWKLVMKDEEEEHVKSSAKFWAAVWSIVIADLSMAFDNVMGVAGAAHGSVALVVFGLLVSIPILVVGSSWLAAWMNKQPFIIYIGGAVLIHTAVGMIFRDQGLGIERALGSTWGMILPWVAAVPLLVWGWFQTAKIKAARAHELAEAVEQVDLAELVEELEHPEQEDQSERRERGRADGE